MKNLQTYTLDFPYDNMVMYTVAYTREKARDLFKEAAENIGCYAPIYLRNIHRVTCTYNLAHKDTENNVYKASRSHNLTPV